ncbi:acetylcholine receptor subunit alpha-like isoform X2 [Dendronephthya gigantea]|uniref:acetylcholine receptor subunit alpha-like isoform X2 n=1 Tax=Dendronephthya gigantea TaxID=151771 RepID=UPI00106D5123|nr:acetylcholine receptor subunit alpha-like isoform X2 [Dendronephthya gigantea]
MKSENLLNSKFLLPILFLVICDVRSGWTQEEIRGQVEQRILDEIFNEFHDPFVRPIRKREDKLVVIVGISYHQLINVNEKDQIITSSIWIRQTWTNQIMTWNKEGYRNISQINADPNRIWKPDLYLYNNADESSDGNQHSFNTKVKLKSNGVHKWLAPAIVKTACKINVKYFPFDEQFCNVTLGSWTYDTLRLDVQLENDSADTSKFVDNGEWDLISMKGYRNVIIYPCCPNTPYADLTYMIRIRRRTRFYYINLIIPCFVITALSILAFKVPPDSGERITLVITNLLSMIVFLLLVADILPPISDATPLISIYYAIVMFEIGFALICTCVVLKVNFRHPSHGDMPPWFRTLVLRWMAKVFRMTPQVEMAESQKKHFRKRKRSLINTFFNTWAPRLSVSRLHGQRESISGASQSRKRRRSIKFLTGGLQRDGEENPTTQRDVEGASGVEEVNVRVDSASSQAGLCDVTSNERQETRVEEVEEQPVNVITNPTYPLDISESSNEQCLACSKTSPMHALVQQQEDLVKHVESLAAMARDMEEEECKREEWKLAAAVLDEFFFWLYLIMIVISKAVVFSMVPDYED